METVVNSNQVANIFQNSWCHILVDGTLFTATKTSLVTYCMSCGFFVMADRTLSNVSHFYRAVPIT